MYGGEVWPVTVGGSAAAPFVAPTAAAGAPVLDAPRRWSLAYGSNASPQRLLDKGLDVSGALLLPASVLGWRRAWEARRTTSTGAVPLTLYREAGHRLDVHVLGITPDDAPRLDASEGRGPNYALGRVGPVAVAARFELADALAYGPVRGTRVLLTGGRVADYPALDQVSASGLFGSPRPPSLAAEPLTEVGPGWPDTPLSDLPLFVYGSLQPGMPRWSRIDPLVEVVGRAEARGTLVATVFGWPAATFDGSGRVRGTLLRPASPEQAVELYRACDEIEDVPSLFRRVAVPVVLDHQVTWAAAYEWNPHQGPAPGNEIPDGTWVP